jgi:membrane protease YdiL (CAAX protease family)
MKPLYNAPKSEEHLSQGSTILRVALITIANTFFMSFAFVLGVAGSWQDSGNGTYIIALVCFAPILMSVIGAILLCLQKKTRSAIRVVAWLIPAWWLVGIGFVVFGEFVRIVTPYLGIQTPCAFRWPPCST